MATVDRKTLLSLAMNLPVVWNSAAADMKVKQRIVRTLIQEIVADVDERANEIVLVIHWVGGRHTEVRTSKVKAGQHRQCTGSDAIDVVRRMAGRWPDEQIAATLNRLRLQTGAGNTWNDSRVASLRQRLELPVHAPAASGPSTLTLDQACRRLGVSNTVLRKLIKTKQLRPFRRPRRHPGRSPPKLSRRSRCARLSSALGRVGRAGDRRPRTGGR
jgi:hypothetical protein